MDDAVVTDKTALLSLPEEIIEKSMSYLSYDEISGHRLVCKYFDSICQRLLNQGLTKIDRYHARILKSVKAQLPRRESERRNHPLARHVDILGSIETRLSLINMTYMKFIDTNACCFIPGKVLDEIERVLRYIETTKCPPRSHELLQELRDISSMAMEHFDEKIAPMLRARMQPMQLSFSQSAPHPSTMINSGASTSTGGNTPSIRSAGIRNDLLAIKANTSAINNMLGSLRKDSMDIKIKMVEHRKKSLEHDKKLISLEHKLLAKEKIIQEQNGKLESQTSQIADLNRKIVEYDQKFVDLLSEVSHIRSLVEGKSELTLAEVDSTASQEGLAGQRKPGSKRAASSAAKTHATRSREPSQKRKRVN